MWLAIWSHMKVDLQLNFSCQPCPVRCNATQTLVSGIRSQAVLLWSQTHRYQERNLHSDSAQESLPGYLISSVQLSSQHARKCQMLSNSGLQSSSSQSLTSGSRHFCPQYCIPFSPAGNDTGIETHRCKLSWDQDYMQDELRSRITFRGGFRPQVHATNEFTPCMQAHDVWKALACHRLVTLARWNTCRQHWQSQQSALNIAHCLHCKNNYKLIVYKTDMLPEANLDLTTYITDLSGWNSACNPSGSPSINISVREPSLSSQEGGVSWL